MIVSHRRSRRSASVDDPTVLALRWASPSADARRLVIVNPGVWPHLPRMSSFSPECRRCAGRGGARSHGKRQRPCGRGCQHDWVMRPVGPPSSGVRMQRSVAACLASILELDAAGVPLPGEHHSQPWTVWRQAADGDGCVGAVAFGAPPGLAWSPLGGPDTFEAVEVGYLIAPADVALGVQPVDVAARNSGTVEAIVLAPQAEGAMHQVDRAVARAGRGLEGDPTSTSEARSPTPTGADTTSR